MPSDEDIIEKKLNVLWAHLHCLRKCGNNCRCKSRCSKRYGLITPDLKNNSQSQKQTHHNNQNQNKNQDQKQNQNPNQSQTNLENHKNLHNVSPSQERIYWRCFNNCGGRHQQRCAVRRCDPILFPGNTDREEYNGCKKKC